MSPPVCTDCGASMQYVGVLNVMQIPHVKTWLEPDPAWPNGIWRCPWASKERCEQALDTGMPVVTCEWPLTTPRQAVGFPDGAK
jgi:hypothetical protein